MIYSSPPTDWRDLQNKVAEVFSEIGFDTEVERNLQTARGSASIDVYAEDRSQSPQLIYVCECKHWDRAVPKSVVHGFRSVVADSGANYGLLISKQGFQVGSVDAAKHTNIELLDWQQFQKLFEDRWFREYVIPQVSKEFWKLKSYISPFITLYYLEMDKTLGLYDDIEGLANPDSYTSRYIRDCASERGLSDQESQVQFEQLHNQYQGLAILTFVFLAHAHKPSLPLQKVISSSVVSQIAPSLPSDLVEATALRDFSQAWMYHLGQAIKGFEDLVRSRAA
jgi:hypothetical protein